MPELRRFSATDAADGTLLGMHPEIDGTVQLISEDLMHGMGNFNKGFNALGSPNGFRLGQPKRAVARNSYGGPRPGELTKQNDSPIDIHETSDVFNRPFILGEPLPKESRSELPKPPPPILKKIRVEASGFPASTTSSPYWVSYSWGIVGGGGVLHTPLAKPTLVPPLSQGQSIKVEIPNEAIEGGVYVGLWLTEPGSSTPTQPGVFRLQKTIRFNDYPARLVDLSGPFVDSSEVGNSDSSTPRVNDTTMPPPERPSAPHGSGRGGLMRTLKGGAHILATYVTQKGETLPSPQYPTSPGWNNTSIRDPIDGVDVSAGYGKRTIHAGYHWLLKPRIIGWHVYFYDGATQQYYRLYDPVTGNGRVRPLPAEWVFIVTQFAEGHEAWAVQNPASNIQILGVDRLVQSYGMQEWEYYFFMYPQDPPGENSSGTPVAKDPLPTPTVFGAVRPGAGHYAFATTEIDEDGRESEPSDVSEIDIADYEVIRIVFGNTANRIPNATVVERGADGLPLDFTFVTTGGSVDISAGEIILKTTASTSGTTPSGITDPIAIDITKDWSVGALITIENPPTGGFAGSFEAVLREETSSGAATDTVLKNGAALGDHAFYQVISETGGTAPAWRSDTTQAQILYRFSGATKNATVRISRQILKDYKYQFRRRLESIPGSGEASDPNPPAQTTAISSGSTAVEPAPTPESVPETLTQTPPDRPILSGTTLQSGDLESAMPTGFATTTSSATLTRETTPTITPLVGSYSLRSRKASGGSLASAFLSKLYGFRSTTLSGSMTNSQNTVPLTDLTHWPKSGTVYVDSEKITYTGKSALSGAGNLTGCTRATYGSSAATHSSAAVVSLLGRDAISLYAKRQPPVLPANGYVTLGELRRWTDRARFAWIDIDTRNETSNLTVTGGAATGGNVTVTLDGVSTNVAVVATFEQSRLTITSGVTVAGGTPFEGPAILSLGGVNYNIPVYGGGVTSQYQVTVSGTAAGTGYFWFYLPDSQQIRAGIAVNFTSGDSASTMASKIHSAVNAAAPNQPSLGWWSSSYTSGATFTITANTNGLRTTPSVNSGSIFYPSLSYNAVRIGTQSPRLQTERFQVLGNFVGSATPYGFSLSLGIPRGGHRSYNILTPVHGDSPVIVAKKIYDEFQAKYTGYEWNAQYTSGSDTVYFVQKNPERYQSAYASVSSPAGLAYSFTTQYIGGENDTADEVATRIRNSNFSGWTTGNSAAVVDFFAKEAGPKTDIAWTASGGVTATTSTPVQGAADTPTQVAGKIVTAYSGNPSWAVTNVSNVVTFLATSAGNKQDATFSPGTTGVQASMTTPIQGSIDIVANIYDPSTTLTRRRRVQTGLTTSSVINTEIAVQGAGTSDGIVAVWGSFGSSAMSLLGWFEGLDLTDYPAGEVALGVTSESSSSATWDVLTDSIEITDKGKTYYETHDFSGNLINQVHGHYLPNQKKSQKLLLQDYRRAVVPGLQYTASGKIRWDGLPDAAKPLFFTAFAPSGQEVPLRDVTGVNGITGTGGWQEFSYTFTVPTVPKCYEIGLASKDISAGEYVIQSLVISPGTVPLRTPYYATSGSYIATFDISTPLMIPNGLWRRKRTRLFGEWPTPDGDVGYTTTTAYQSGPTDAGPFSGWVSDPDVVPENNIIKVKLEASSDGLETPGLPSGVPSVEYMLLLGGQHMSTFLKGNRSELVGGAAFVNLKRPQQLKDYVVHRLPGESYNRAAVSGKTGRSREFELQVFTPEATTFIEENWAELLFSIEAFGKWYQIRLSAEPDFDPQVEEWDVNGQTYGWYIAKMPRAQIVQLGDLS